MKVSEGVDRQSLTNLYQLNPDPALARFLAILQIEEASLTQKQATAKTPIRKIVQTPCTLSDGHGNSSTAILTLIYTVGVNGSPTVNYTGLNFTGPHTPTSWRTINTHADVSANGTMVMSGVVNAQWAHSVEGTLATLIYYNIQATIPHHSGSGYVRVNAGQRQVMSIE